MKINLIFRQSHVADAIFRFHQWDQNVSSKRSHISKCYRDIRAGSKSPKSCTDQFIGSCSLVMTTYVDLPIFSGVRLWRVDSANLRINSSRGSQPFRCHQTLWSFEWDWLGLQWKERLLATVAYIIHYCIKMDLLQ